MDSRGQASEVGLTDLFEHAATAVQSPQPAHEPVPELRHEPVRELVIDLREPPRYVMPRPAGRVLFVGSSGGHLAQMLPLAALWPREARAWVTFDTTDARSQLEGERTFWAHHPTTRSVKNLLRNGVLATSVLRQVHPDLIVSTGAAVAVPFFAAARAVGIPTAYLEVYDRIDTPTLTGRLCRPISSLFMVQWDEQLVSYPGAVKVGHVL